MSVRLPCVDGGILYWRDEDRKKLARMGADASHSAGGTAVLSAGQKAVRAGRGGPCARQPAPTEVQSWVCRTGHRVTMRAPPVLPVSMWMEPRWTFMIRRTMASPRPTPPNDLERLLSRQTKGSNTTFRLFSGMPGPSSSTEIWRVSSWSWMWIWIQLVA